MSEKEKSYKDLQQESRKAAKRKRLFYDSGKRVGTHGHLIKKGTPYVKGKEGNDDQTKSDM